MEEDAQKMFCAQYSTPAKIRDPAQPPARIAVELLSTSAVVGRSSFCLLSSVAFSPWMSGGDGLGRSQARLHDLPH